MENLLKNMDIGGEKYEVIPAIGIHAEKEPVVIGPVFTAFLGERGKNTLYLRGDSRFSPYQQG